MKKATVFALCLVLLLPIVTLAQQVQQQQMPNVDVLAVLVRLTNWLWTILLIVAVIAIIIAGFVFATAGGNPEQIKKARDFILYAIVGVVVAGIAYGTVSLIRKAVEG